jgi:hypothetical protein
MDFMPYAQALVADYLDTGKGSVARLPAVGTAEFVARVWTSPRHVPVLVAVVAFY